MRVEAETMTLYAVTDRAWAKKKTLMEQVEEALEGGITFLQLREKNLSQEEFIKEAKEILKAKGASYKNLTFDSDSTVGKYAGNIMAFPTTVLVDKDGNIVGEPFMGGIDDQSNYDQLMKQIQSVLDQK